MVGRRRRGATFVLTNLWARSVEQRIASARAMHVLGAFARAPSWLPRSPAVPTASVQAVRAGWRPLTRQQQVCAARQEERRAFIHTARTVFRARGHGTFALTNPSGASAELLRKSATVTRVWPGSAQPANRLRGKLVRPIMTVCGDRVGSNPSTLAHLLSAARLGRQQVSTLIPPMVGRLPCRGTSVITSKTALHAEQRMQFAAAKPACKGAVRRANWQQIPLVCLTTTVQQVHAASKGSIEMLCLSAARPEQQRVFTRTAATDGRTRGRGIFALTNPI